MTGVIRMTEAEHMAKLDNVIAAYVALMPYGCPALTTETEKAAFAEGLALGYQAATRGIVKFGNVTFEREG